LAAGGLRCGCGGSAPRLWQVRARPG